MGLYYGVMSSPGPAISESSDTNTATTSSGTDTLLTSMSITPAPGTYNAYFNTSITSNAAGAAITCSFYVGGVQQPQTLIKIVPFDGGALSATSARGVASCLGKVTVDGTQAIEIRWSTSSGTATCHPRLLQVSRCS